MLANSTEFCNLFVVLSNSRYKTPHLQGRPLLWNLGLSEFIIGQLQLHIDYCNNSWYQTTSFEEQYRWAYLKRAYDQKTKYNSCPYHSNSFTDRHNGYRIDGHGSYFFFLYFFSRVGRRILLRHQLKCAGDTVVSVIQAIHGEML
jgi:hypothetical protein